MEKGPDRDRREARPVTLAGWPERADRWTRNMLSFLAAAILLSCPILLVLSDPRLDRVYGPPTSAALPRALAVLAVSWLFWRVSARLPARWRAVRWMRGSLPYLNGLGLVASLVVSLEPDAKRMLAPPAAPASAASGRVGKPVGRRDWGLQKPASSTSVRANDRAALGPRDRHLPDGFIRVGRKHTWIKRRKEWVMLR